VAKNISFEQFFIEKRVEMDYELKNHKDSMNLIIKGKISREEESVLANLFEQIISSEKDIVINLTKLTYLSYVGIRFFFELEKNLSSTSRVLLVIGVSNHIKSLFEETGLIEILTFD
jgi:anti-anti-sigma factor